MAVSFHAQGCEVGWCLHFGTLGSLGDHRSSRKDTWGSGVEILFISGRVGDLRVLLGNEADHICFVRARFQITFRATCLVVLKQGSRVNHIASIIFHRFLLKYIWVSFGNVFHDFVCHGDLQN